MHEMNRQRGGWEGTYRVFASLLELSELLLLALPPVGAADLLCLCRRHGANEIR